MPYLLRPERWQSQPKGLAGVNWSNGLSRELIRLLDFERLRDVVTGSRPTLSGSVSRKATPAGSGLFVSGGGTIDWTVPSAFGAGSFTVFVLVQPGTWASYGTLFTKGYYEAAVLCSTAGVPIYGGQGGGAGSWSGSGFSVANGQVGSYAMRRNTLLENSYEVLVDRKFEVNAGYGSSATDPTLKFGASASGGAVFNGTYLMAALWNRGLSRQEIIALRDNPWQLFRRDPGRVYFFPAGGAGNYSVSIAEALSASDALAALGVFGASVAEAGAVTDAASAQAQFGVALTESAAAADALAAVATYLRSVAETAAATDSVSSAATLPASLAEAGSAADSISALGTFGATLTESGSASDTVTTGAAGYSVAIAEAASAADAISAVLTAGAALTETAAASDAISSLAVLLASLAEAGSASEVVSTTGASYSVSFAEAATAIDAIAAQLELLGIIVEAGAATDGVSTLVQFGAAVAEAVAALDAVVATGIFGVTITEAGAATDLVSAPTGFGSTPANRTIYVRHGSRVIAVHYGSRTIQAS